MTFKYPWLFLLFLVYGPLIIWYFRKNRNSTPSMGLSTLNAFAGLGHSWKEYLMKFNFILKLLAIGFLIVALCRPQTFDSKRTSRVEGTDIILALDISGSMASNFLIASCFE